MRGQVRGHEWHKIISKPRLRFLYEIKRLSQTQIANLLGVSLTPIQTAMRKYGITPRTQSEYMRGKDNNGPSNPAWKGEEASYKAKHQRIYTLKGAPQKCEICGASGPGRRYDWACIGDYNNPSDFVRLCKSCHVIVDGRFGTWSRGKNTPRAMINLKIRQGTDEFKSQQIANHIRTLILRGDIKEGMKLPPSQWFADLLGVSQFPVLSAYRQLREEGLVMLSNMGTIVSRRLGK